MDEKYRYADESTRSRCYSYLNFHLLLATHKTTEYFAVDKTQRVLEDRIRATLTDIGADAKAVTVKNWFIHVHFRVNRYKDLDTAIAKIKKCGTTLLTDLGYGYNPHCWSRTYLITTEELLSDKTIKDFLAMHLAPR